MACLYIVISQLLMDQFQKLKKILVIQTHGLLPSTLLVKNMVFKVTRPLIEKAGRFAAKDENKNKNTKHTQIFWNLKFLSPHEKCCHFAPFDWKWLQILQQIPQAFDPDFIFIKIFEIPLVWPQNVKTSAYPFSSIA